MGNLAYNGRFLPVKGTGRSCCFDFAADMCRPPNTIFGGRFYTIYSASDFCAVADGSAERLKKFPFKARNTDGVAAALL